MNLIDKNIEELERDFYEIFANLRSSNSLFDEGQTHMARSIAANIFSLIHDASRKQPSSLTLIDRKKGIRMTDTSLPLKNAANMTTPLVGIRLTAGETDETSGAQYIPKKGINLTDSNCPVETSLKKWFDTKVLVTEAGHTLSRKNLVFTFRHEKFAHSSKHYKAREGVTASAIADMERGDTGLGWRWINTKGEHSTPTYGQQYATIRQIGWEVEETLSKTCKDILDRF